MRRRIWHILLAAVALATVAATPVRAQETPPLLIALGDSTSAGAGLQPLPNASPLDTRCERSSESYPYLVAGVKQMALANLSCTGARVWDGLLTDQDVDGPNIRAQLRAAEDEPRPAAVTVSVMANDVYWRYYLSHCRSSVCGERLETLAFDFFLAKSKAQLWAALAWIQSLGPERIFVVGYYDPLGSNASCLAQHGITADEVQWLRGGLADLNNALADSASLFSGVTYVEPDFGRRGICSSNPLVQDRGGGLLHPTAEGQQVIADAVLASW